jgi:hypothetical protein
MQGCTDEANAAQRACVRFDAASVKQPASVEISNRGNTARPWVAV